MTSTKKGLTTLENPLLYNNFLKVLERNNPDIEIDPDDIDRTLEYDEAFNELKELYPGLQMSNKEKGGLQQFRDYLRNDFGIDERKVQNLIIQDPKQPFSEDDLAGVGALHGRSDNAILTDRAKKAPITRDVRKWASKPNRLDLGGIDRPGARDHHLEARINILAEINGCSRKRSCGTVENVKNSLERAGKYDKRDIEKALTAAKDASQIEYRFEGVDMVVAEEIGNITISVSKDVPVGDYHFGIATTDASANNRYGGHSQPLTISVVADGTGFTSSRLN